MKALFVTLLMPMGIALIGLIIMAVFAWRARNGRPYEMSRALLTLSAWMGVLAFGLYLTATPVFGLFLSHILTSSVRGKELLNPKDADAIVVLTGGMVDAGPVGWMPKPETVHRLAVAYELQRMINLRLPVIVSGGHTAGGQNPSEASVAASFFSRQRTELTPTELEEASTDTYESALQLAPILAKRGVKNMLLVTSDVHMLRALSTFRARGMDAIPVPAMVLPANLGIKKYLPSAYGAGLTAEALYELYGTFVYLISSRISYADLAYTPQQQAALHASEAARVAAPGQDMSLPTLETQQVPQPDVMAPPTATAREMGSELPFAPQSVNDAVRIDEPLAPRSAVDMKDPVGPVETPADY